MLWAVPLVFAEPAHFLVELPEHIGCDTTSRDPLRNTRTIVVSQFSYWLTNGNNFHVGHHYKQWAPISELPAFHEGIVDEIEVLVPTYRAFYRQVLRGARRSTARARNREPRTDSTVTPFSTAMR